MSGRGPSPAAFHAAFISLSTSSCEGPESVATVGVTLGIQSGLGLSTGLGRRRRGLAGRAVEDGSNAFAAAGFIVAVLRRPGRGGGRLAEAVARAVAGGSACSLCVGYGSGPVVVPVGPGPVVVPVGPGPVVATVVPLPSIAADILRRRFVLGLPERTTRSGDGLLVRPGRPACGGKSGCSVPAIAAERRRPCVLGDPG